jgi:nucleoside-diphosphate-sugar epimerase
MIDRTRCLVTGASGFVGSHLVRRLLKDGAEVHVLARNESPLSAINDVTERITVHRIGANSQSVVSAVECAQAEIVFHVAAHFKAEHEIADVRALVDSNIAFTADLLEGMKQTGSNKLINTGTAWQHFHDAEYDPVCLYAATKQAAEDLITYYRNAFGIRSITLKLFDTYGPGDVRKKLFHAFHQASASEAPLPFSGGDQLLDLVHIDDVVEAFVLAAKLCGEFKPSQTETFGISARERITLRDAAKLYESISGLNLNIAWGARPYRIREVMNPWSRCKQLPNWMPSISLEYGIRSLLAREK